MAAFSMLGVFACLQGCYDTPEDDTPTFVCTMCQGEKVITLEQLYFLTHDPRPDDCKPEEPVIVKWQPLGR